MVSQKGVQCTDKQENVLKTADTTKIFSQIIIILAQGKSICQYNYVSILIQNKKSFA